MRKPVSTGIAGLDQLLSGGLQPGSCTLIEGVPGTGKTTVGVQFIYTGALAGESGIIITFEQFPQQIKRDAANLGWDLDELERQEKVKLICTSPQVFLDQLQAADGFIEVLAAELGARRILLDSVSQLGQLGGDARELRTVAYGMLNGLRRAGLTSVITKELESLDAAEVPFEEYLVDCVIRLRYDLVDDHERRRFIEVLKSRGGPHISGKHVLELGEGGVKVYPRHRPAPRPTMKWEGGLCRTATGVAGLDEMLGGGLICGFSYLVAGSAGVGKTTLALQFLCQGAEMGEKGVYVTMEEAPNKLSELAAGYGLSMATYEEQGLISVVYHSPIDTQAEKLIHELKAEVRRLGAKRVVLDSIADLAMTTGDPDGEREAVFAVVDALEVEGVTTLLVAGVPELFGQSHITGEQISVVADGIILLKYVEMHSEIQRAVSILKMRGSDHDKGIRRFTITNRGMAVHGRFEGTEGLMGGSPRATPIELAVRSFSEFDERLNDELLDRFAQLHPQVKPAPLSIPYNPDEARDVVVRAMASPNTSLSVVPLCMYWMPEVIDIQRLAPLNDVHPPSQWAQHLDGLVKPTVVGEWTYAVPAIALCGVLLYRKDLLEASGFSGPPATWDELIGQAQKVIKDSGRDDLIGFEYPAYTYEGLSSSFLVHLWSNGGDVVDERGDVIVDSPSAQLALGFLRDVIHRDGISPQELTAAGRGVEPQDNFLSGRTVFLWMLPSVMQGALRTDSPVRDRIGLAPPPVGPLGEHSHSFLGGWHYAVPRGALAPSAARQFISFMTGYDIQKERALRGGPLPTLKAIYDDQEVLAFHPHYRELKDILANARCREEIPHYSQVTQALQLHLHPVLQGLAEPEAALQALAADLKRIMKG